MNNAAEKVTCDLCGSSDDELLVRTRDWRYGHDDEYSVVRCQQCGMLYLNPRPRAEAIVEQYKEDYRPVEKATSTPSAIQQWGRSVWRVVGGYYRLPPLLPRDVFLDVGCFDGKTLEVARRRGAEVYGVEMNPHAVKLCRRKNLRVRCGTLESALYASNYFDVIWMSQVLEHVPSPRRTLKEIYRLLKPGGRVFIFCPNAAGYLAALFGPFWHGWHIPFHFYAYTPETITQLIASSGLQLKRISTKTPWNFLRVSWKSRFFGSRTRAEIERRRLIDSGVCAVVGSLTLRVLDCIFWGKGDCLEVEAIKR